MPKFTIRTRAGQSAKIKGPTLALALENNYRRIAALAGMPTPGWWPVDMQTTYQDDVPGAETLLTATDGERTKTVVLWTHINKADCPIGMAHRHFYNP